MKTLVPLALASALCSACGSSLPLPTGPSENRPGPVPPVAIPPVGSPASGNLSASSVTATVSPKDSGGTYKFEYSIKFDLVETTGRSGATIDSIKVIVDEDGFLSGAYCWGTPIRVAPGGTLRLFASGVDEALGYCSPGPVGSSAAESELTVLLGFVDDQGQYGRLEIIARVSPLAGGAQ